jgi:hypothetical protein
LPDKLRWWSFWRPDSNRSEYEDEALRENLKAGDFRRQNGKGKNKIKIKESKKSISLQKIINLYIKYDDGYYIGSVWVHIGRERERTQNWWVNIDSSALYVQGPPGFSFVNGAAI